MKIYEVNQYDFFGSQVDILIAKWRLKFRSLVVALIDKYDDSDVFNSMLNACDLLAIDRRLNTIYMGDG